MKENKFKSVTALVLTFVLIFAVFVPIFSISAAAEPLEKCVYFSDYEPCQIFYNNEIDRRFEDSDLYYYDSGIFDQEFIRNYIRGDYSDISNAYVIFEIRRNLLPVAYDPNYSANATPLLLHLVDFFDELKNRGCQIMFISSVHHVRMSGYHEDLLANVDVHVDIAIWDRFVLTAMYNMWNASGQHVENTTIILDECLSQEDANSRRWFTYYYIKPFIRALYRDEIMADDLTTMQLLDRKNIKIIYYIGDGLYRDALNENAVANTTDDIYDFIQLTNNTRIFALGSSAMGYSALNDWLFDVNGIREHCEEVDLRAYVYNFNGYDLSEHSYAKVTPSDPDVTDIMLAFITDNTTELESFDNYSNGISNITYNYICGSHVNQSKTAWLMDFEFGDSDFPIGWMQAVMGSEDYNYYFDDDDDVF